ncbi:MAG: hypothetical protein SFU98_09540 [Leptospiraceae bacterium]|nr:hypothetical protein [Leptospiraceae bacterium]
MLITKIFYSILLLITLLFNCKEKPNLLSEKYAETYLNDSKTKKLTETQVTQYLKNGDLLNKSKKYDEAIQEYETGLKIFPTPELYYSYGNTLSNLKKNNEAKEAFKLALKLNYDPIEILYYNLACIASLQENKNESLQYLTLAIKSGYNNLEHIKKDSDLIWLRSQIPNFAELISEILSEAKSKFSPAGMVYVLAAGGGPIDHYFCGEAGAFKGNFVIVNGASYPAVYSKGNWRLSGNTIKTIVLTEKGKRGYGKIINEGPRHQEFEFYKDYNENVSIKNDFSINHLEEVKEAGLYKQFEGSCPEY